MEFEFATATRIIFGNSTVKKITSLAAEFGKNAFLVTDKNVEYAQTIRGELSGAGFGCKVFYTQGEPSTKSAMEAVEKARNAKADFVIGLGGGSVLDTGKVVASMLNNSGDIMDYLEVVGKGLPIQNPSAGYIAIPTTSGTGAEVTRNAVLAVPEHNVKVSMRSPFLLPRIALVDPELTISAPPSVTASTGLDALTQLLEAYVSNKANPLTDGICLQGLERAARSLKKAYLDGCDKNARQDMSIASLFGGLSLANAKLGAVHGFAGPLGGMIHAAHGAICAALLPWVFQANVKALSQRASDPAILERFETLSRILTNDPAATSADAVKWISQLCSDLKVPGLSQLGLKEDQFETAVEKAQNASSMKGNPIMLNPEELLGILEQAY